MMPKLCSPLLATSSRPFDAALGERSPAAAMMKGRIKLELADRHSQPLRRSMVSPSLTRSDPPLAVHDRHGYFDADGRSLASTSLHFARRTPVAQQSRHS